MIELDEIDTDDDGALTAVAELPGGRRVTVQYDFDNDFDLELAEDEIDDEDEDDIDPENLPDLEEMQQTAEHALARLSAEILDARQSEVVDELVELSEEEDDDTLADDLNDDLVLDGVVVFGDGGMTLLFVAPAVYPDTTILCLLDDDLEIEDLAIE